jgi:hypothetical protein
VRQPRLWSMSRYSSLPVLCELNSSKVPNIAAQQMGSVVKSAVAAVLPDKAVAGPVHATPLTAHAAATARTLIQAGNVVVREEGRVIAEHIAVSKMACRDVVEDRGCHRRDHHQPLPRNLHLVLLLQAARLQVRVSLPLRILPLRQLHRQPRHPVLVVRVPVSPSSTLLFRLPISLNTTVAVLLS